jgi:amino acid transporter
VLGATLGRHYGVITYFALMATTGSIGILLVYVIVAVAGMVFFWRARRGGGESYNVVLDIVLPLIAVAVCGYTIYSSIFPRPPAPISYSLWIALGLLVAGLIMIGVLVVTRPDRVAAFGRAFETTGSH